MPTSKRLKLAAVMRLLQVAAKAEICTSITYVINRQLAEAERRCPMS